MPEGVDQGTERKLVPFAPLTRHPWAEQRLRGYVKHAQDKEGQGCKVITPNAVPKLLRVVMGVWKPGCFRAAP